MPPSPAPYCAVYSTYIYIYGCIVTPKYLWAFGTPFIGQGPMVRPMAAFPPAATNAAESGPRAALCHELGSIAFVFSR